MKMPNNLSAPGSKTSPLIWVLFISVIANLFLVGVLAGGLSRGSHHKHFGPLALATPHGEYMVDWMVRYLNPQDATAFREAFQSQAAALKQSHDQVHQAIKNVAAVFEQTPRDADALQAAIDHLGKAQSALNDVVGKIMQNAYSKLSPDGRHRLAELTR